MGKTIDIEALEAYITKKTMAHKNIHGFSINILHNNEHIAIAKGNLTGDKRFFAASVTKLFVTTLILKLIEQNKLSLDDLLVKHLDFESIKGIHTFKGVDYTDTITIRHLLSNRSGLPDYFHGETMKRLLNNHDEGWGYEKVIEYVKRQEALFLPGEGKKAKYVDTNFQLLGKVIETLFNLSFSDAIDAHIIKPLALKDTYLYDERVDQSLIHMTYKGNTLTLPKYMASIGPEGGIVSTAKDLNQFLFAFFEGKLFNNNILPSLYNWKLLFGPGLFFYGTGISMQPISLRKIKQGLIGHWGQSGAFAFYYPQKDLYMSGTINAITGHNKAAKVMMKVLKSL